MLTWSLSLNTEKQNLCSLHMLKASFPMMKLVLLHRYWCCTLLIAIYYIQSSEIQENIIDIYCIFSLVKI